MKMNGKNFIDGVELLKKGITIKTCMFCHKEFECSIYTPVNKVFCSDICSKSYYSNKYEETHKILNLQQIPKCAYCNKEFIRDRKKPGQKYCSKECATNANNERLNKRNVWSEMRKCAHCGKEFKWVSSKVNQKYCNRECATNANNERLKSLKRSIWSEMRKCAHCGKEFEWVSNKAIQKYCNEECQHQATLLKIRNYNKSNKKTDEQLRNEVYLKVLEIISRMNQSNGSVFNKEYIDYSLVGDISSRTREYVLERDGYECQICRRKDFLQLHHLIKRKNGGTHKSENLITLCASCHRHIETGDVEHATNKCLKNVKRYYNGVERDTTVDLEELNKKLIILFDKLKESEISDDSEIMVCLDEALDLIETE